jgi:hypothetical protein
VLVLEREHLEDRARVDVGVAVAVAADPAAEAQRPGLDGELDPQQPELVDEGLERVRDGVTVQLVEVVDGVASLVEDVGARDAQLVGLPQQVDELLEPPPDAALGRGIGRLLPFVEQRGDTAQLREHGAASGLRGVGGEDGAHREVPDVGGDLARPDAGRGDRANGLGQPCAARRADRGELAPAVHLLGDVGEVEVRRERPHEPCGGGGVGLLERRGGGLQVGAHQVAYALDEVEHLSALLAHERAPEQDAQLADVAPQRGVRLLAIGGGIIDQHRRPWWRSAGPDVRTGDPPVR